MYIQLKIEKLTLLGGCQCEYASLSMLNDDIVEHFNNIIIVLYDETYNKINNQKIIYFSQETVYKKLSNM